MYEVRLWMREEKVLEPVKIVGKYGGREVPEMTYRGVPQIWNRTSRAILLVFQFENDEQGKQFYEFAIKQRDWFN